MLKINELARLYLGVKGENESRTIFIDMSAWAQIYPNATVEILHRRQGDQTKALVTGTEYDEETKVLSWTPTDYDTFYEGFGIAEIRMVEDEVVKKTKDLLVTAVSPSVIDGSGTVIESNYQAFLNSVTSIKSQAVTEKNAAKGYKEDAEAYAIGKRNGSDVGSTDPTYHNNAKYYAEYAESVVSIENVAGVSIETLEPGSQATVIITESGGQKYFHFGIPKGSKGDKGDTGNTGATGATPDFSIGTVQGGETAAASITGTAENPVLNLTLPKGDKGDTGNTGATGATPDFQIGTVQTGAAGSSAEASITGTAEEPVLNLKIPKGDKGDTGEQGPTGQGVPAGGTDGDFLVKDSNEQDGTKWQALGNASSSAAGLMAAADKALLDNLPADLAIVESTDTATHNISSGQFVVWKGSLYKASAAIASGDALSASNLSAVSDGGLNEINNSAVHKTGDEDIAGIKTFNNTLCAKSSMMLKNNNSPYMSFRGPNLETSGAAIYAANIEDGNQGYGQNYFIFREYSPKSDASGVTGSYENFLLPRVDVGRSSNSNYNILTSKTCANGFKSSVAAGTSVTYDIGNSFRGVFYCIGVNTNSLDIIVVSSNSTGGVTYAKMGTSSNITITTGTGTFTITTASGSGTINVYVSYWIGSIS